MCKRASFEVQKGVFYNAKGRKLTRSGLQKYGLPKPLQGEGMYLAGYVMLGVGEIEG